MIREVRIKCGILLLWNARNANKGIIRRRKTRKNIQEELNIKNSVDTVTSIHPTRKQDKPKSGRPVAQLASAPDSKSGGWGFESLQACNTA